MSKTADMGKVSVRGSFNVMWGLLASTVISAVGAVILAWVLGASNYGLYAVVLSAPSLILLFHDLGINYAVTRYSAQLKADNKAGQIRGIILSGFIFKTLFGLALSVLCLLLAPLLATTFFHRPYITDLIRDVSFVILAQSLVNTATAAFTGVENMQINSVMVVCQAIIKTVLAPALVIAGLSLHGAILGYTVSYLVTALIGVFLVWTIYRTLPSLPASRLNLIGNIRLLLKFGLPLALSDMLSGFLMQFYTFILAIYVSNNALIGNYGLATNFVIIVTFVSTPINTMLFPAFSKIDCENDYETLKRVFQSSVKYTTLLVMPVVAMLVALATPGVSTLFADRYAQAPFYLALLALNYVLLAFGMYSTTNLINSQESASIKIILAALTFGVGLPLGFVLISQYGVVGMLVTLIFDGVPSVFVGLVFVKKRYNLTIDWLASGKIIASSAVAGFLSYLVVEVPVASVIQLVIGIAVFLSAFVVLIALTRTLSPVDIENLHVITSDLGKLTKIVNPILKLLEKISHTVNG